MDKPATLVIEFTAFLFPTLLYSFAVLLFVMLHEFTFCSEAVFTVSASFLALLSMGVFSPMGKPASSIVKVALIYLKVSTRLLFVMHISPMVHELVV